MSASASPPGSFSPGSSVSVTDCLGRLADFICAHREPIIRRWLEHIRADPRIPSADHLSVPQLSDHLPKLFDDLADALRAAAGEREETRARTTADARIHGGHRWEQNFRLDELVRELNTIQGLIVRDGVRRFRQQNQECDGHIDRAMEVIAQFFGDTGVGSVEQYVAQQQAQLRTVNAQLARADAARRRVLSTVAHEMGNSVYALRMLVQSFASPAAAEESFRRHTLELTEGVFGEINAFLLDLTDYSTLLSQPRLEMETFVPHGLAGELTESFRPAAEAAGLHLEVTVDPALEEIHCDRLKLRRIAANLLTNAIKFRRPGAVGGRVAVSLAPLPGDADRWRLRVEDDGVGIAAEEQETIFDEFVRGRTTEGQPGVGLGLAITRQLVRVLGGEIAVESTPERGSVFTVTLPRFTVTLPRECGAEG